MYYNSIVKKKNIIQKPIVSIYVWFVFLTTVLNLVSIKSYVKETQRTQYFNKHIINM